MLCPYYSLEVDFLWSILSDESVHVFDSSFFPKRNTDVRSNLCLQFGYYNFMCCEFRFVVIVLTGRSYSLEQPYDNMCQWDGPASPYQASP